MEKLSYLFAAGTYAANKARCAFRCVVTVTGAAETQVALHARVTPPAACRLELLAPPPGPIQWGVSAPVRPSYT